MNAKFDDEKKATAEAAQAFQDYLEKNSNEDKYKNNISSEFWRSKENPGKHLGHKHDGHRLVSFSVNPKRIKNNKDYNGIVYRFEHDENQNVIGLKCVKTLDKPSIDPKSQTRIKDSFTLKASAINQLKEALAEEITDKNNNRFIDAALKLGPEEETISESDQPPTPEKEVSIEKESKIIEDKTKIPLAYRESIVPSRIRNVITKSRKSIYLEDGQNKSGNFEVPKNRIASRTVSSLDLAIQKGSIIKNNGLDLSSDDKFKPKVVANNQDLNYKKNLLPILERTQNSRPRTMLNTNHHTNHPIILPPIPPKEFKDLGHKTMSGRNKITLPPIPNTNTTESDDRNVLRKPIDKNNYLDDKVESENEPSEGSKKTYDVNSKNLSLVNAVFENFLEGIGARKRDGAIDKINEERIIEESAEQLISQIENPEQLVEGIPSPTESKEQNNPKTKFEFFYSKELIKQDSKKNKFFKLEEFKGLSFEQFSGSVTFQAKITYDEKKSGSFTETKISEVTFSRSKNELEETLQNLQKILQTDVAPEEKLKSALDSINQNDTFADIKFKYDDTQLTPPYALYCLEQEFKLIKEQIKAYDNAAEQLISELKWDPQETIIPEKDFIINASKKINALQKEFFLEMAQDFQTQFKSILEEVNSDEKSPSTMELDKPQGPLDQNLKPAKNSALKVKENNIRTGSIFEFENKVLSDEEFTKTRRTIKSADSNSRGRIRELGGNPIDALFLEGMKKNSHLIAKNTNQAFKGKKAWTEEETDSNEDQQIRDSKSNTDEESKIRSPDFLKEPEKKKEPEAAEVLFKKSSRKIQLIKSSNDSLELTDIEETEIDDKTYVPGNENDLKIIAATSAETAKSEEAGLAGKEKGEEEMAKKAAHDLQEYLNGLEEYLKTPKEKYIRITGWRDIDTNKDWKRQKTSPDDRVFGFEVNLDQDDSNKDIKNGKYFFRLDTENYTTNKFPNNAIGLYYFNGTYNQLLGASKIDELKNALVTVASKAALDSQLEASETEKAALESALKNLKDSVEAENKIKEEADRLAGEIDALRKELKNSLDALNSQLKFNAKAEQERKEKVFQLQSAEADLRDEKKALEATIVGLKVVLEKEKEEASELKAKLEAEKADGAETKDALLASTKALEETKEEVTQLKATLTSQLEDERSEVKKVSETLKKTESEKNDLKNKFSDSETALAKEKEALKTAEANLEKAKDAEVTLAFQLEASQDEKTKAEEKARVAEDDLARVLYENDSLVSQLKSLQDKRVEFEKTKVEEANKALEAFQAEIVKLTVELKSSKDNEEQRYEAENKTREEFDRLKAEIIKLQESAIEAQNKGEEVQTNLKAAEEEVTQLKATLTSKSEAIEASETEKADLASQLEASETEKAALAKKIEGLKAALEKEKQGNIAREKNPQTKKVASETGTHDKATQTNNSEQNEVERIKEESDKSLSEEQIMQKIDLIIENDKHNLNAKGEIRSGDKKDPIGTKFFNSNKVMRTLAKVKMINNSEKGSVETWNSKDLTFADKVILAMLGMNDEDIEKSYGSIENPKFNFKQINQAEIENIMKVADKVISCIDGGELEKYYGQKAERSKVSIQKKLDTDVADRSLTYKKETPPSTSVSEATAIKLKSLKLIKTEDLKKDITEEPIQNANTR